MGRALSPVDECQILRSHPRLTFREGPYSYQIFRKGDQSFYTVTDGVQTVTEPIQWAFGQGGAGQTYVFRHKGSWYESRVSFFNSIQGLDLTLGAQNARPKSLEEAAGREMNSQDARDCFSCHATAAVSKGRLQMESLTAGITCEGCHGPGQAHVAAVRSHNSGNSMEINKLRNLSTEELSDFCGSCHRSWSEVILLNLKGLNNVRFQPYRLTGSKCYDAADRRISCVVCHDPHQALEHTRTAYDSKCLACHSSSQNVVRTGGRHPTSCPVGKQNCTDCHMPKYELPGAHFKFTDHHIRVVRQNDTYPN